MIEYINGRIEELTPTYAVLDINGIGYLLNISLNSYEKLQSRKEAKLYAYEVIREDAHLLYGFVEREEREMFLNLISVSGVGANTARVILSSLSVIELAQVIGAGNSSVLKSVKGIGAKTAERIIVDLKGKVSSLSESNSLSVWADTSQVADEAVAALCMLGYAKAAASKSVGAILKIAPTDTVESVIKKALKML